MGSRRIKLFELTLEGKEHNVYKIARRLNRILKNKTEITSFLFFENEKCSENGYRYEYLVDVNNVFDINAQILQEEVKKAITKTTSNLVAIKDFDWIEKVIANFD